MRIAPGSADSVAGIVECWVRPLVELASNRESKCFIALLAREAGDATADTRSIVSGYLDPSVEVCLRALRQALPGVGEALIIQGYLWMIAATMSTITAAGRAQRLAGRTPMPPRPDALLSPLVAFITGGCSHSRPRPRVATLPIAAAELPGPETHCAGHALSPLKIGMRQGNARHAESDPLVFHTFERYRNKATFEAHLAVLKEVQAKEREATFLQPLP